MDKREHHSEILFRKVSNSTSEDLLRKGRGDEATGAARWRNGAD
jgi:hypothetical protein